MIESSKEKRHREMRKQGSGLQGVQIQDGKQAGYRAAMRQYTRRQGGRIQGTESYATRAKRRHCSAVGC